MAKPESKKPCALPPRQERFVKEYSKDLNGTQAAARAGYSTRTAAEQASRLLTKAKVAKAVAEANQQITEKIGIEAVDVLRQVYRILMMDPRRLVDHKGVPIPLHKLPDDVAAAIQAVEIEDQGGVLSYRYRFAEKNSAADKLMKHLGLFEKDNSQKSDPVTELIKAIRDKGSRLPIRAPEG
jgi:phage terminase small subunit